MKSAALQQWRALRGFVIGVVLLCVMVLSSCTSTPPEAAVRARIVSLQAAIDARDAGALEDLLAEDFVGNDGIDRRGARQLAAGVFLRYRDVAAKLGPVDVRLVSDSDAIARFTVLATAGSGGLLPEQGQVYEVETGWRYSDGEWRLRSSGWKLRLY